MQQRRHSLFSLVFLLVSVLPRFLSAQPSTGRFVNLGFQQNFNTYSWNADINLQKSLRNGRKFSLRNHGLSNLLRPVAGTNKWRDQEQFGASYSQPLFGQWNQNFSLNSNLYLDSQTGYENSASTQWLSWGINRNFRKKIQFLAAIGHKWDTRQGHRDKGLYHRTQFFVRPTSWQGYVSKLHLAWEGDELGRRRDYDVRLRTGFSKEFYPGTIDSLTFQLNNLRRDYYISTQGDLESRREKSRRVSNWLVYPISQPLTFRQFFSFSNRKTTIHQSLLNSTGERDREDLNTLSKTALEFQRGQFFSTLSLDYSYHTQTYTFSRSVQSNPFSGLLGTPDNKSRVFALKNLTALQFGWRDSLRFLNSVSRFQYDTPDTNNFDDRDELRTTHLLEWTHLFSLFFQLKTGVSARLHHLVYIFAAKSAENNWNRIFNFYTELAFHRPRSLHFRQRAEVLANYTDYDFEVPSERIRSFVFRKLAVSDSLRWPIFDKTEMLVFSRYEIEENGRFSWENFAEQPLLSRRNHFLSLTFDFPLLAAIRASAGLQGYFRQEWPFVVQKNRLERSEKSKTYTSYGPVFKLYLTQGRIPRGVISISTLRVKNLNQRSYLIHQMQLQALWNF